jgi:UV DNA damage repair endonuclease
LTLHNWQFKMMSSNKYELTKAVRRNIIRHYKLTKTILVLTHCKIARDC